MRFILIDARNRRVWNMNTPQQISDNVICRELTSDAALRKELTHDMDLWVPDDPKTRSFRLFSDGPEYFGDGLLCGRTKLGDIKSLPRFYNIDMVEGWFTWPQRRSADAVPVFQRSIRPAGFPRAGLALDPYHRITAGRAAREINEVSLFAARINAPKRLQTADSW